MVFSFRRTRLLEIRRWDAAKGELTLASVRQVYDGIPSRISEYKYPPGAKVADSRTRRCTLYFLGGACVLTTDTEHEFSVGDVVDLEACHYALRVLGKEELLVVKVWDLRPYVN
jgi:hypothetical protein